MNTIITSEIELELQLPLLDVDRLPHIIDTLHDHERDLRALAEFYWSRCSAQDEAAMYHDELITQAEKAGFLCMQAEELQKATLEQTSRL